MVLFQLTLTRALTVYVAQGLVCAFFIFLAYKILKRDRKRLNIIFSGFYLSAAIGLLMNFIYAPISDEIIVEYLNFITNFGIFYSPIFLVVFNLILLKSEKVITTVKQLAILIGFGVFMFCMILFILTDIGVTINATTEWSPEWSLPFFLYLIIGETVLATGPILYFSFKVYNKFEDMQLRKKWRSFIFGFCALIVFMYAIFISNFLASYDINVRLIMMAIAIILGVVGAYLMYNGVGRQLEK
ncbi:MAG: hypothetical protein ACXAEX_08345 [Promethearchaeota archaeon]